MSASLEGRVAVVTGAGRGLGRAVAVAFAQAGAIVWIVSRTDTELEVTARMIREAGGTAVVQRVDLADPEACLGLGALILGKAGRLDVLVNNAAVLDLLPVEDVTPDLWSRTLAVNLSAPFLLIRSVLPMLRTQGGSIINVSSRAGVLGFDRESAYCASKFGLEGLTRALACELESAPVSVNTITPGLKIKPTSVTDAESAVRSPEVRAGWNNPTALTPAFLWLGGLRGEVSGRRFNAFTLSRWLETHQASAPADAVEVAE